MMSELEKQCLQYFRKEGFYRLMLQLREKYRSLGHVGGTVVLNELSKAEKRDLNGFLRMDLSMKKDVRISVTKLEKLMLDTKFADISLETLLQLYFEEDLVSKKTIREQMKKQRDDYFESLYGEFKDTLAGAWLVEVLEQKSGVYQTLIQRYEAYPSALRVQLKHVMSAINNLPVYRGRKLRLPVFASSITQDPHSFDEQREEFTLLLHGICYVLNRRYRVGMNAEERMQLLYDVGIQKDDISNFTTVFRMYGFQEEVECSGWRAFADAKQPLQLSLMNLNDMTSIAAEKYVFVVENPSVFSTLVEYCIEKNIENVSLMCTYGQLRISSFIVLDLLMHTHDEFYYAGDFDPEGLQIAQGLLMRYMKSCKVWRYNKADYEKARSGKAVTSMSRNKLKAIKATELEEIKQCLLEYGDCAYQEQLLSDYCHDLLELK